VRERKVSEGKGNTTVDGLKILQVAGTTRTESAACFHRTLRLFSSIFLSLCAFKGQSLLDLLSSDHQTPQRSPELRWYLPALFFRVLCRHARTWPSRPACVLSLHLPGLADSLVDRRGTEGKPHQLNGIHVSGWFSSSVESIGLVLVEAKYERSNEDFMLSFSSNALPALGKRRHQCDRDASLTTSLRSSDSIRSKANLLFQWQECPQQ
jgi:hypothetical protein